MVIWSLQVAISWDSIPDSLQNAIEERVLTGIVLTMAPRRQSPHIRLSGHGSTARGQ